LSTPLTLPQSPQPRYRLLATTLLDSVHPQGRFSYSQTFRFEAKPG